MPETAQRPTNVLRVFLSSRSIVRRVVLNTGRESVTRPKAASIDTERVLIVLVNQN